MIIYKHKLDPEVVTELELTKGATILHFANQRGSFCIWEAHDETVTDTESRTFQIVGTGDPADVDMERYIATALFTSGTFVFHLFEVT